MLLFFLCYLFFCFLYLSSFFFFFFFFNDTATTEIYTLSLHDALPIYHESGIFLTPTVLDGLPSTSQRSEEHTSELQSRFDLVCRLLLEKKKKKIKYIHLITTINNITLKRRDRSAL